MTVKLTRGTKPKLDWDEAKLQEFVKEGLEKDITQAKEALMEFLTPFQGVFKVYDILEQTFKAQQFLTEQLEVSEKFGTLIEQSQQIIIEKEKHISKLVERTEEYQRKLYAAEKSLDNFNQQIIDRERRLEGLDEEIERQLEEKMRGFQESVAKAEKDAVRKIGQINEEIQEKRGELETIRAELEALKAKFR